MVPLLKTNEVAVPPPDLMAMDTARLKVELTKALGATASRLVRLAWIVRILEERGEDLSDLGMNLIPYLRRIAYGQLSAEAVVRFSGSPALMETIAALPRPEQDRMAAGESVTLVVPAAAGGSSKYDLRRADPAKLTRRQFRQVFARGRLRDEAEQILFLESAGPEIPKRERTKPAKLRPDKERGGFWVKRTFVSAADAVAVLSLLSGVDVDDESVRETPFVVNLSEVEHTSLGIAASRGRVSMRALVRRAMAAAGLFGHS